MSVDVLREAATEIRDLWNDDEFVLAVADWLDDIAQRHSEGEPQQLVLHYDSDEACETCEWGGHETPVCNGCFPSWEGMDGYAVYPCRETLAALTVARAYLDGSDRNG